MKIDKMKFVFLFVLGLMQCLPFYCQTISKKGSELYNRAIDYYEKRDYNKSLNAFKKLIPYMPLEANFFIGEQYYYGQGVSKDITQAIHYYEKAAELGDAICQQKLGKYYFGTEDNIRNKTLAFYWNHVASLNPDGIDADAGEAAYMLSYCYLNGIGTSKNIEKGEMWMAFSAILSNPVAEEYVENILGIDENDKTNNLKLITYLNSKIVPKLRNSNTIESKTIKCLHYFLSMQFKEFYTLAMSLVDDIHLPRVGKKLVYQYLLEYYKQYKYDLYNAEIIEKKLSQSGFVIIQNNRINDWLLQQYIKCMEK